MDNSLAAVYPELIAEWSKRNLPITPCVHVISKSFGTVKIINKKESLS